MFLTIYEIVLGDLNEEQAKIGSANLIMAIVGSALLPRLQGPIIDIGRLTPREEKMAKPYSKKKSYHS
mgnify:CR=1 FL=1